MDLDDMERRLTRAIPSQYRAFVADRSASDLGPTLAAPAELAALNLEQRAEGADGPTKFGFVLYCSDGDCLLLRDGDDSGRIYEWSHETREISGRDFHISDLLKQLSSIPSGEFDADDPTVVISRVAPWTRSILDPIQFSDLVAVAAEVPEVEPFEWLETTNPFTQAPMRFAVPGLEIRFRSSDPLVLELQHGRLMGEVEIRPVPDVVGILARRLKAHVFARGS